jgi:signal transduction histidine kinase
VSATLALIAAPRRARPLAGLVIAASVSLTVIGSVALSRGAAREGTTALAALTLVAALSFVGSGLVAWRRRPETWTGPLMVLAGFCLFATSMAQSDSALPFTIGIASAAVPVAVLAHLVLAFPDGRLHSRLERAVVAAAYLGATLLQVVMLMFMGYEHVTGCPCPHNLLLIRDDEHVHSLVMGAQRVAGVALALIVVAIVALRWRAASPPLRRAMGPLVATGSVTILLLGAVLAVSAASNSVATAVSSVERVAFATVPVAYVLGLFRSRLARAAVGDLVVALRRMPEPGRLRDALARALRDPSLELAYWIAETESYVGLDGQPVEPVARAGRAVTVLERRDRPVAALVHDDALLEDPGLLDAVSAAAGLALENGRLLADLRAQLEELRESRARIVEAGDTERRRLERNLHDGAQQRLVSLSLALNMAGEKVHTDADATARLIDGARDELTQALAELRELAEGIHPAILTDRGLEFALERLAERAPVPLDLSVALPERPPAPVEAAAYYVVAESLTNVAKYARATRAHVRVEREDGMLRVQVGDDGVGGADPRGGSGLRGLGDRVQALGGRLRIESPAGGGTRITAELPI